MGDASAQEVERHVCNSSSGPTLRTEREMSLDMIRSFMAEITTLPIKSNNMKEEFILTDHSEQSAVLKVRVELHQSWLCARLPLNKTTKEKHEKCSVLYYPGNAVLLS